MEEIWKDIDGYEGIYQVSNLGNVRSLNWGKRGIVRNLYLKKQNRGYLHVELAKNGKRKAFTVHRLVANAFLENPNGYPIINHKDENKQNNNVENLEWCSLTYNVRYSMDRHSGEKGYCGGSGRKKGTFGAYKHKSPVLQIGKDGDAIKTWDSVSFLERETGWRASSIVECCNGKRHTAYGYIWRFAS